MGRGPHRRAGWAAKLAPVFLKRTTFISKTQVNISSAADLSSLDQKKYVNFFSMKKIIKDLISRVHVTATWAAGHDATGAQGPCQSGEEGGRGPLRPGAAGLREGSLGRRVRSTSRSAWTVKRNLSTCI